MKNTSEQFSIYKTGVLVPDSPDELEMARREIRSTNRDSIILDLKNLPRVAIGNFEIFSIKSNQSNKTRKKSGGNQDLHNYFVVRFPINFYPTNFSVEDVKFAANFTPNNNLDARVVDLYPREQVNELKRNIRLNISPSITFAEVSVNVFDLSFDFVYDEIRPLIYGSGTGLSHVYWNMKRSINYFIAGTKVMHTIIRVPKQAKQLTVTADLQASLQFGSRFLNTIFAVENDTDTTNLSSTFDLKSCTPLNSTNAL